MTRQEIREYRNTIGGAIAVVALVLFAQGVLDRLERHTDDQIAYAQWIADACTPAPGETVIAKNDAGKLHCTIYSHIGYGLAPVVISAAVMEVPL